MDNNKCALQNEGIVQKSQYEEDDVQNYSQLTKNMQFAVSNTTLITVQMLLMDKQFVIRNIKLITVLMLQRIHNSQSETLHR